MTDPRAIDIAEIEAARRRIAGVAVETPLLPSPALSARHGRPVLIKCETLQRTGSFKFRGAYNRLVQLDADQRRRGVVAWSSGNHAQGVAAAAALLGMPAAIVMPADAPALKRRNTAALGAEIIAYDRARESREAIATALAAARGAVLVPSFDDPDIIAGQGTAGLEIVDQAAALGLVPAQLLVCCGGGGLVAGIATAITAAHPGARLYAVEPEGFDDTARSLRSGRRETIRPGARSICDALLAPQPGALTFPINRALLAGGLVVTDGEVVAAMRFAFETLKLVVEPGGAVALAALLAGRVPADAGLDPDTDALVLLLSGGNIDAADHAALIG
ncbi:threonine/serine dehydratase [Sphingomonas morindae]|uniref:Threonine/serine dehydratase n=1 Tax=Sphingomonas morindae TaxID=1541170 RepID=A0ABY4XBV9_9SPHN|nr:threonine/serine dehydratase [Sphingomonas morindae]USI74370.1 threonine/serine dehydratase [Sphingomonas morindae]